MVRGRDRRQPCSKADARARLSHARLYLDVADTVLGSEDSEEATVAAGNAVLAAIAAADAICCVAAGIRFRGGDHAQAADLLEEVTGDRELARLLRDVVMIKDQGHYGLENVVVTRAKAATRKAAQIVAVAEDRLR